MEQGQYRKTSSRKWIVTVWAMSVGTMIVAFLCLCQFLGKGTPDGLVGLATLLFSTGVAYIGGNVLQKQIMHKEGEVK